MCCHVICCPNGNTIATKIILVATVIFYFQIFGGFLVNLGSVGSWLNWLQYLSIFRFALNVSKMKSKCIQLSLAIDFHITACQVCMLY